MDDYDVVVIGGGPVGCRTASMISSGGFQVCILEEHENIGKPVQCAGIVSPRVLDIAPFHNSVQNKIYGALIRSPSGRTMKIESDFPKAIVIDRAVFDSEMSKEAVKNGTDIKLGCKALGFSRHSGIVDISYRQATQNKKMSTKLLIGADGMQGRVAKTFDMGRPITFLYGFGAETQVPSINERQVGLFTGKSIAPGFFAWSIPLGNSKVRLGLCIRKDKKQSKRTQQYFNNFIELDSIKSLGVSQTSLVNPTAGAIPIGMLKKTVCNNVMVIGDAAAQVKPTSGGGIYTGLRCSRHCGNIALEALKKNDLSVKQLKKYEHAWREEIGNELKKGWIIHNVYSSLTDKQLEDIFDMLNKPNVLRIIEKEGDLDFASNLSAPLLKEAPGLIKFAGKFLKAFF